MPYCGEIASHTHSLRRTPSERRESRGPYIDPDTQQQDELPPDGLTAPNAPDIEKLNLQQILDQRQQEIEAEIKDQEILTNLRRQIFGSFSAASGTTAKDARLSSIPIRDRPSHELPGRRRSSRKSLRNRRLSRQLSYARLSHQFDSINSQLSSTAKITGTMIFGIETSDIEQFKTLSAKVDAFRKTQVEERYVGHMKKIEAILRELPEKQRLVQRIAGEVRDAYRDMKLHEGYTIARAKAAVAGKGPSMQVETQQHFRDVIAEQSQAQADLAKAQQELTLEKQELASLKQAKRELDDTRARLVGIYDRVFVHPVADFPLDMHLSTQIDAIQSHIKALHECVDKHTAAQRELVSALECIHVVMDEIRLEYKVSESYRMHNEGYRAEAFRGFVGNIVLKKTYPSQVTERLNASRQACPELPLIPQPITHWLDTLDRVSEMPGVLKDGKLPTFRVQIQFLKSIQASISKVVDEITSKIENMQQKMEEFEKVVRDIKWRLLDERKAAYTMVIEDKVDEAIDAQSIELREERRPSQLPSYEA